MSKHFNALLLLAGSFLCFHSASALDIAPVAHNSFITSCDGGVFTKEYYAKPGVTMMYPADDYYTTSSRDGLISSQSEVSVYSPGGKMTVAGPWRLTTNYFP